MDSSEVGEALLSLEKTFIVETAETAGNRQSKGTRCVKYVRQDCDRICHCGRSSTIQTTCVFVSMKRLYGWLPFRNCSRLQ